MALGNGSEHAGQIGMWFNLVQLTGLDDRCEHSPVLHSCIMAREERVFTVYRNRPHAAFYRVVALLMAWMPPPTGIVMCHCDVLESNTQRESIHVRSHRDPHRRCIAHVSTSRSLCKRNGYFLQESDACSASCIYEPTPRVPCCDGGQCYGRLLGPRD